MKSAGINPATFSAHSCRAASAFAAKAAGLNLKELMRSARWPNAQTFALTSRNLMIRCLSTLVLIKVVVKSILLLARLFQLVNRPVV